MRFQLSNWEIIEVVFSILSLLALVVFVIVEPQRVTILWYLPNLAFVVGVTFVGYRFRRQNRTLTFRMALLVTGFGLCVTTGLAFVHYSSVFNLPVSQIDTVGLIHGYVPVWIFPVVSMYPLGAASSDSQRLLVGGLLLLNALFVSNQFDALHDQFLWMGICFLGSLLGYPLAVIGNHS